MHSLTMSHSLTPGNDSAAGGTDSSSFNQHKRPVYTSGDLVQVISGELQNLVARIKAVNAIANTVTVIPYNSVLTNEFTIGTSRCWCVFVGVDVSLFIMCMWWYMCSLYIDIHSLTHSPTVHSLYTMYSLYTQSQTS